jgi:hypothetical protein
LSLASKCSFRFHPLHVPRGIRTRSRRSFSPTTRMLSEDVLTIMLRNMLQIQSTRRLRSLGSPAANVSSLRLAVRGYSGARVAPEPQLSGQTGQDSPRGRSAVAKRGREPSVRVGRSSWRDRGLRPAGPSSRYVGCGYWPQGERAQEGEAD